jgi:hypothetical protein
MLPSAKAKNHFGSLILAASLAGTAIAGRPAAAAASTNVAVGSAAAAPTIVVVRNPDLRGVVGRLQTDGYTVVTTPESTSLGNVLQNVDGPVIVVADVPRDSAVSAAAAADPQVKAVVYVTGYDAADGFKAEALSCRFDGSSGFAVVPYLTPVGVAAPACTSGRDAYDAATADGIVKTAQSVARAAVARMQIH